MNPIPCEAADLASIGAAVLSSGARLRFRARGVSMRPFIADLDILIVEPVEVARLRLGDVVLFRTKTGEVCAHRLVKKEPHGEGYLFTMRGDARLRADRPVSREYILGRVVAFERRGRILSLAHGWTAWLGILIALLPDRVWGWVHGARSARPRWKRPKQ